MFPLFKAKQPSVVWEAALAMNTSHSAARDHLRTALKVAHGQVATDWSSDGPWVSDVFPSHVVYQHKNETLKRSYSIDHGAAGSVPKVTLGEPKKVHVAYVDTPKGGEAMTVLMDAPGDWEPAQENFVAKDAAPVIITLAPGEELVTEGVTFDGSWISEVKEGSGGSKVPGRIRIKIIGPGWGSMAHYSEKMIKESGPAAFIKGTHMYMNHPAQEGSLVERPVEDLAAVLTENAAWDEAGPLGKGLYAEAKTFSDHDPVIREKGPYIGASILAGIKGHVGEADGRSGKIADAFTRAYSVDFVNKAGAKGAPVVAESLRVVLPQEQRGDSIMTEAETTQFATLRTENATLQAQVTESNRQIADLTRQQNVILAVGTVAATLREAEIEFNPRILERSCQNPVMKEGILDLDWVKGVVSDFTGNQTGRVAGLGRRPVAEADKAVADKAVRENLKILGVPEAGMEFALRGSM